MSASSFPEPVVAAAAAEEVAVAESPWPYAKRFAVCSAFVFYVFVNWAFPIDVVPWTKPLLAPVDKMWNALVPAVAKAVFHVNADVQPNGSGDTTWNYVQLAIWVVASLAIGAAWAALLRKRARATYEVFRIYLRFALAASMVTYGVLKVIQLQFPSPWLERLVQPFGSASPMGVLWTFMGLSRPYNFITGAAEMAAGILLTMRRTTLAGALLAIVVLGNIVALNFCYDVPVKLYSSELLSMAVVIALPDAKRLIDAFLRAPQQPLFRKPALETASLVARTLFVAALLLLNFNQAFERRKTFGDLAPRSPLRGIWNVDELTENGVARPPLVTDVQRWRRVVFDHSQFASILLMSDARQRYTIALTAKSFTLKGRDDPKDVFTLGYARPNASTLVLDGDVHGRKVHAVCHLGAPGNNLLMTRGFHWVNEYPFNR